MGKNDMFREDDSLAVDVIKMVKKSLVRVYVLLILFIILFVFSIIDSIYQRCRVIDLLEEFEVVEETIETYDMKTETGSNNFIGGDNNGNIENNKED